MSAPQQPSNLEYEFLAEVRGLPQWNLALEMLRKLEPVFNRQSLGATGGGAEQAEDVRHERRQS